MYRQWDRSRAPRGAFTLNQDCPQAQGLTSWWPVGGPTAARDFLPDFCGRSHLTPGTAPTAITLDAYDAPRLTFNGTTSYLTGPASVTTWPMSMFSRVRLRVGPTADPAIVLAATNPANLNEFWMDFSPSSQLRVVMQGGGGAAADIASYSYATGVDYDMLATFTSNSTTTLYVNAAAQSLSRSGAATPAPSGITSHTMGGLIYNGSSFYGPLDGMIGESAFWNKILDAEIARRLSDPGLRFELWYPLRSKKWFSQGASTPVGSLTRGKLVGSGIAIGGRLLQ